MTRRKMTSPLTPAEKEAAWGDFAADEAQHLDEVDRRWGDTREYEQSAAPVATYTAADWVLINESNAAVERRIREAMDAGVDPASEVGMDAAEAQRAHIVRWFYDMDHDFHILKSVLYVHDPRFRRGIEKNTRPGAAEWLQAAIVANGRRHAAEDPVAQPPGQA